MNEIEKNYIDKISIEHRKKYGQFYTIDEISSFMMEWILEKKPSTIYDPAFGMGSFYRAAQKYRFNGTFFASEVDTVSYNFYNKFSNNIGVILNNEDYFSHWDRKYDAIICNPPYLKFQKFNNRDFVLGKISTLFSQKISGYTNVASAFLIKSVFELNDGGRLAYIMPVEFLNTGYGKIVKNILMQEGNIHHIIQIEDEMSAFEGVTTTVCVILFEKIREKNYVTFSKIKDIHYMKIEKIRTVEKDFLDINKKWMPLFEKVKDDIKIPNDFIPLSTYGKFKRGIATGANEFFSLKPSDVKRLKLQKNEISYCISKSNQIHSSIFDDSLLKNMISNDEYIYILNIHNDISENAKKYIKYGEQKEYHKRYLTRTRTPWFSIEKRIPAPIWFGVFSRGEFKIIRNTTKALNLTCYHGFVPFKFFENYVDRLFIFLKSQYAIKCINNQKRLYGNKLSKMEPSDLSNVMVPAMNKFDKLSDKFVLEQLNSIYNNDKLTIEGEEVISNILFK